jgi:LysR family glycine cleavage system transcriptional activator
MTRNIHICAQTETASQTASPNTVMNAQHLPPLRALQCFVASARYLSYERAALRFNVTAPAVGQQVRSLEEHLRCQLFNRARGILELTPTGRALYLELAPAFDRIEYALAIHGRSGQSKQLTIAATPGFAALWLVPRLGTLQRDNPSLDVRVLTSTAPLQDLDDAADCAVVFGGDVPSGLLAEPFMTEAILPVCAPALLSGQNRYALLHDESPDRDLTLNSWTAWRDTIGGPHDSSGLRFDDPVLGLAAAQAGLGIWLARARLVAEALSAGRLVRPFGIARRSACAWRFAVSPAASVRPLVKTFRQWLEAEAAAAPELPA